MNSRPQHVVLLLSLLGGGILLAIAFSFLDVSAKHSGRYDKKWLGTNELFSSGTPTPQGGLSSVASRIPKKPQDILGESTSSAAATPTASASAKATATPSASPSTSPSASPTPSPSSSPQASNAEKACFDFSSEYSFNSDTFYYGKPLVLDAACSENGRTFRWALDNTPFSAMGQTVTVYPSGKPVEALRERELKLTMTGKSGASLSTTKKIKLKSVPDVIGCFTPDKRTINFSEEVAFSGSCTQSPAENSVTRYYWKFRDGDGDTQIVKEGKDVTHGFGKFSKNLRSTECDSSYQRGFEAEFCIETRLGSTSCSVRNFCPSATDPKVQALRSCMLTDKTIDTCIKDLNL